MNRIEQALQLADDTRDVLIRPGAISELGSFFRKNFGSRRAAVVADENTLRAIGGAEKALDVFDVFLFPEGIHAEMPLVESLRNSGVLDPPDVVPVAVGSGTVNDLVKYASSLVGKPYLIVGTAASMDGYTSFGASIEHHHCKQTFSCPAPAALLIDSEIAAAAPVGMSASGFADLAAKIPAGADWLLADALGTEPLVIDAWNLVQKELRTWLANPSDVANRKIEAINGLIEGLVMSGLAMQRAKSSRTASGAEHQFSHLLDNLRHTYRGTTPSHGFKVGIGTVSTCALYEKVITWKSDVFFNACQTLDTHFRSWESIEAEIAATFADEGLAETARQQCRQKFVDQKMAAKRLLSWADCWPELRGILAAQLIPAAEMQKKLQAAGAPSRPEEIGLTRRQLHDDYAAARLLRCRYNILDLVADVGLWDETVGALFAPGGFWSE